MGDEDDDVVMVNNNYKSAMQSARSMCVSPSGRLETALNSAWTAMEGGAWTGSGGDDFAAELSGHRTALNEAGPAALETFDTAIGEQPDKVEQGAWQTHWQNLAI